MSDKPWLTAQRFVSRNDQCECSLVDPVPCPACSNPIRIYDEPWRVIRTEVRTVQQTGRATRIDLCESNGIALRWRSIAVVDLSPLPRRLPSAGVLPRAIARITRLLGAG